jgi:tetratricopeptide (TPR) repeat protein
MGRILSSPDVLARSQPAPYYRPLHRLSFVVDGRIFGLDPRLSHGLNVALHAAAALALFVLGLELFAAEAPAFLAASVFAVHPVNAEAVDFVTARNNLLVALLVLASTLAWLRARRTASAPLRWLGAGLLFLGLGSKETAFMLLPFLALLEGLLRSERPSVRVAGPADFAPMGVAVAAYLALRAAVLSSTVGQRVRWSDLGTAVSEDLHILPQYLKTVLWPSGLTVHHADPSTYFPEAGARAIAWLAMIAAVVLLARQRRLVSLFGLLWFAVNFAPVSGIIPIPSAPIAERFLYVPAIGLWLLAADQVEALAGRPRLRRAAQAAALAACLALAGATIRRNRDWKDDQALFTSALRVDPASTEARYNLAIALADRGDADGARRQWERVLSQDAAHTGALSQLGTWHAQRGELEAAGGYFGRVLSVNPRDVETRFNLAVLLERLGRKDEALRQYREFLRLEPVDYPDLVPRVQERIRRPQGERAP